MLLDEANDFSLRQLKQAILAHPVNQKHRPGAHATSSPSLSVDQSVESVPTAESIDQSVKPVLVYDVLVQQLSIAWFNQDLALRRTIKELLPTWQNESLAQIDVDQLSAELIEQLYDQIIGNLRALASCYDPQPHDHRSMDWLLKRLPFSSLFLMRSTVLKKADAVPIYQSIVDIIHTTLEQYAARESAGTSHAPVQSAILQPVESMSPSPSVQLSDPTIDQSVSGMTMSQSLDEGLKALTDGTEAVGSFESMDLSPTISVDQSNTPPSNDPTNDPTFYIADTHRTSPARGPEHENLQHTSLIENTGSVLLCGVCGGHIGCRPCQCDLNGAGRSVSVSFSLSNSQSINVEHNPTPTVLTNTLSTLPSAPQSTQSAIATDPLIQQLILEMDKLKRGDRERDNEMKKLKSRDRERDNEMKKLKSRDREREQQIVSHNKQFVALKRVVVQHEATIVKHKATIAKHEAKIAKHEAKIVKHEATIAKHETIISKLNIKVCEMTIELNRREQQYSKLWWSAKHTEILFKWWVGVSTLTDAARASIQLFNGLSTELQREFIGKVILIVRTAVDVNGLRVDGAHPIVIDRSYEASNVDEFLEFACQCMQTVSDDSAHLKKTATKHDRVSPSMIDKHSTPVLNSLTSVRELFAIGVDLKGRFTLCSSPSDSTPLYVLLQELNKRADEFKTGSKT